MLDEVLVGLILNLLVLGKVLLVSIHFCRISHILGILGLNDVMFFATLRASQLKHILIIDPHLLFHVDNLLISLRDISLLLLNSILILMNSEIAKLSLCWRID